MVPACLPNIERSPFLVAEVTLVRNHSNSSRTQASKKNLSRVLGKPGVVKSQSEFMMTAAWKAFHRVGLIQVPTSMWDAMITSWVKDYSEGHFKRLLVTAPHRNYHRWQQTSLKEPTASHNLLLPFQHKSRSRKLYSDVPIRAPYRKSSQLKVQTFFTLQWLLFATNTALDFLDSQETKTTSFH